jgi:hypothetical protein
MIAAAADATDVLIEGDRLWHWIDSYAQEHDLETVHIDNDLIVRFGAQKAFVMACLADQWGSLIEGVEQLLRMRARNPRGGHDLLQYLPEHCPDGGWPGDKAACTDGHRTHARFTSEPFSTYWTAWQGCNDDHEAVVPRRLPECVAQQAARSYLSVGSFIQFADIVNLSAAPYVPGFSKDSYFTDEETHLLVLSAMWRAAIRWIAEGDMEDAIEFPFHPDTQAEIVTNMVRTTDVLRQKVENFGGKAPYSRFAIFAKGALLSIATSEGKTSFWYEETDSDRFVRNEGLCLRVGRDRSGLSAHLRRIEAMNLWKVEAIGLDAPWPRGE